MDGRPQGRGNAVHSAAEISYLYYRKAPPEVVECSAKIVPVSVRSSDSKLGTHMRTDDPALLEGVLQLALYLGLEGGVCQALHESVRQCVRSLTLHGLVTRPLP